MKWKDIIRSISIILGLTLGTIAFVEICKYKEVSGVVFVLMVGAMVATLMLWIAYSSKIKINQGTKK